VTTTANVTTKTISGKRETERMEVLLGAARGRIDDIEQVLRTGPVERQETNDVLVFDVNAYGAQAIAYIVDLLELGNSGGLR
jgi:hypothetical protein